MTNPLGHTRTVIARNHAMIAPDTHVIAPLTGWRNTPGAVLIAPDMGAGFCHYLAMLSRESSFTGQTEYVERFILVREGAGKIVLDRKTHALKPGSFAFIAPNVPHEITTTKAMKLIVFEKVYQPIEAAVEPKSVVGHIDNRPASPFMGDPDAMLAALLPGDESFDLAVNLFTFKPGAALPLVESHVFEHGLYMTQGQGIYRLDNQWFPVQENDVIWMGPFCPQWFCAYGKGPAQYLYSKNINRNPIA